MSQVHSVNSFLELIVEASHRTIFKPAHTQCLTSWSLPDNLMSGKRHVFIKTRDSTEMDAIRNKLGSVLQVVEEVNYNLLLQRVSSWVKFLRSTVNASLCAAKNYAVKFKNYFWMGGIRTEK